LPPGVGTVPREHWEQLDGLAVMRLIFAGDPLLPVLALFGGRPIKADPGRTALALTASEWLCHRGRDVVPGVLAHVVWDALSGASITLGPPGARLGIVNLSIRFVRPLLPDGRELIVEARVIEHQGDAVVTSATVTDADGEQVASAYQTSVLLRRRARPATRAELVLATIVFTDLVGSTAKARQLGDEQWRQLLSEHETLVRHELEAFRGREIKTTGDGFVAIFDSPTRAVRCARAIRDATKRLGMEVRSGIHTGDCELAGGDVTGIAVHFAARVLNEASPGEVLVSSTVRDLLLGAGLTFEDRGRHELKGIEGDWQLFALEE